MVLGGLWWGPRWLTRATSASVARPSVIRPFPLNLRMPLVGMALVPTWACTQLGQRPLSPCAFPLGLRRSPMRLQEGLTRQERERNCCALLRGSSETRSCLVSVSRLRDRHRAALGGFWARPSHDSGAPRRASRALLTAWALQPHVLPLVLQGHLPRPQFLEPLCLAHAGPVGLEEPVPQRLGGSCSSFKDSPPLGHFSH